MTLAILIVGALLVMQNDGFTVGMLVAFQMFAGRMSQPLLTTRRPVAGIPASQHCRQTPRRHPRHAAGAAYPDADDEKIKARAESTSAILPSAIPNITPGCTGISAWH